MDKNSKAIGRKWIAGISLAGVASVLAMMSSGNAASNRIDRTIVTAGLSDAALQDIPADLAARFEDAPYGVDPIVSGPVSAAFKKTQEAANCEAAIWPNIPAACYPD